MMARRSRGNVCICLIVLGTFHRAASVSRADASQLYTHAVLSCVVRALITAIVILFQISCSSKRCWMSVMCLASVNKALWPLAIKTPDRAACCTDVV